MKRLPVLILILFLVACATQLKIPLNSDAERGTTRWAGYDSLKLAAGFSVYKNSCGRCHTLHLPGEFSEEQWNKIIPKMAWKAKLDSTQTDLVYKYVLVMATLPEKK